MEGPQEFSDAFVVLEDSGRGTKEYSRVVASIHSDGELVIELVIRSEDLERATGDSDYEHWTTVAREQVEDVMRELRRDLGRPAPDAALDRGALLGLIKDYFGSSSTPWSTIEEWLRRKGISYKSFAY